MNRFTVLVTFTLYSTCMLAIGLTSVDPASRATYLEQCNSTRKCDKRLWLTCEKGFCNCTHDNMLFGPVTKKNTSFDSLIGGGGGCVVKGGERCKFAVEDDQDGKPLFEILPCVKNSACDSDGICTCKSDYFEDVEGKCQRERKLKQDCNATIKCSKASGLECENGVCQCDRASSVYEATLGRCVGLAGSPCKKFLCVENATCHDGTCDCEFGYFRNLHNLCVRKVPIHGNCTEDAECAKEGLSNTLLKCINGTCNCDPSKSVYATVKRSALRANYAATYFFDGYEGAAETLCAPKAGLPCTRSRCAPGAYCYYDDAAKYNKYYAFNEANAKGTCNCEPGTVISQTTGECAKPHEGVCESSEACVKGLACVQGRCRCKYRSQIYNKERQVCVSRADGPCRHDDECRMWAECKRIGTFETGHCKCRNGTVPTVEGDCEAAYGMKCNATTICDTVAGLVCVNRICDCQDFSQFSETHRKCLGFVGTECDPKEENECVAGAECVKNHDKLKGKCNCRQGYFESAHYECDKVQSNSYIDKITHLYAEERSKGHS